MRRNFCIYRPRHKDRGKILSEKILSQVKKHQPYGGVVPELASREHSDCISNLTRQVLNETNLNLHDIDGFAATTGPGLLGGLLVGCNYAKGLSIITNKPFLSINHLQGHVLISRMNKKINFPFLCLLVSGGHSLILLAENLTNLKYLESQLTTQLERHLTKLQITWSWLPRRSFN